MMEPEPVEELADYAHQAWSGWMQYLFESSEQLVNGSVIIPRELVERWKRQMSTQYADLPEAEKESDRKEAFRMLDIIRRFNENR